MKQTLLFLVALAIIFLAACGGQRPAAAAKADTTAACCDSATLARCRSDSSCGGCGMPNAADSSSSKAEPCPAGG